MPKAASSWPTALHYAKQLGATHIVDAATLTGAIVVALGRVNTGVFGTDDAFTERVLASAKSAGEKMWHMPLDDDYRDLIKSTIADIQNVGGRWGGAISAAWFLREFTGDTPWVHLDIAGTAWLDDAKPWAGKGGTGVAVRTLVDLAMNFDGRAGSSREVTPATFSALRATFFQGLRCPADRAR